MDPVALLCSRPHYPGNQATRLRWHTPKCSPPPQPPSPLLLGVGSQIQAAPHSHSPPASGLPHGNSGVLPGSLTLSLLRTGVLATRYTPKLTPAPLLSQGHPGPQTQGGSNHQPGATVHTHNICEVLSRVSLKLMTMNQEEAPGLPPACRLCAGVWTLRLGGSSGLRHSHTRSTGDLNGACDLVKTHPPTLTVLILPWGRHL